METRESIINIYEDYIKIYTEEVRDLKLLKNSIYGSQSEKLFKRDNFVGHITGSAIIFDYKNSNVLLYHHKKLDAWLQPGGHIDPTDNSILEGVLREVKEETGIREEDLILTSPKFGEKLPIDIDIHHIPANSKEMGHFHYDLRFFFVYKGKGMINYNDAESNELKWTSLLELSARVTFIKLIKKIQTLLYDSDLNNKLFYEEIISKVNTSNKYISVAVSHILPDTKYHLKALNKIFPIKTIITKPKSINTEVLTELEKDYSITRINERKEWYEPKEEGLLDDHLTQMEQDVIKKLNEDDKNIILFDIGGYFAHIHETWPNEILERISLIVEDTENGHQKYEEAIRICANKNQKYPLKVVSVARSALKDNEDFLVGQSIFFSADAILREEGKLIQYLKCGILGYGKVGKSIAHHLLQRGIKPLVFDTNPIKRISAFNELNMTPNRDIILQKSDIIFSATGKNALGEGVDFRNLKNGCYIFSVTSSDDELNLDSIAEYSNDTVRTHIVKYYNDINFFYLVNNGNAVNFIHNAVMGGFIHLVRGEMILSINKIDEYKAGEISVAPPIIKKEVAEIWIKIFIL